MTNEFLKLTTSPLMNLDHTYRYSGTKLIEPESLSQHILDTIMLGIRLIDTLNEIEQIHYFDYKEYIRKAVYHDLEEVITGDIPRPLKYFNQDTSDSLKYVANRVAQDLFNSQTFDSNLHLTIWEKAKEGKEGFILKLVDTLVVAHKVNKEVSILHNLYMLRVAHEVKSYLQEYMTKIPESPHFRDLNTLSQTYLKDVIQGAIDSMEVLLTTHKDAVNDLHIISQSMI